ncbi:MAG: tRNA lysidine(34) synthetase TilS [Pseudomonadota bacterium]
MRPTLERAPEGPLGVAVSGGSDSVALLLLISSWAKESERLVKVVSVDHCLREESAAEAKFVSGLCSRLGLPHQILNWAGEKPCGNLQAQARGARRRLIAAWAQAEGVPAVALGHTIDDQAETFLLRLARGSGVDGLASMRAQTVMGGLTWLRPMLGIARDDLRSWLRASGVHWIEDPSNSDFRFDRVRVRSALDDFAGIGLTRRRLAETAHRLQLARDALEASTRDLSLSCVAFGAFGDVTIDPRSFATGPEELRTRLLASVLRWVGGQEYRPRFKPLSELEKSITRGDLGGGTTLHGCVLRQRDGRVVVRREPSVPIPPVPLSARVWDRRWRFIGSADSAPNWTIGALGRLGLASLKDWRKTGAARETLLSTPAVWRGNRLIAAPLVERANGFEFQLFGFPSDIAVTCHSD